MVHDSKYWYGVAILIGTIVGAGIFGIPYAVQKSGLILGLILLVILGVSLLYVNLLYGEVVLRTKGKHRLVGFTRKYFGDKTQTLAAIIKVIGLYGSFLAYLVLGGIFLYNIFNPYLGGAKEFYSLFFFILASLGVILGIKVVSRAELIMVVLLLITVLAITFLSIPFLKTENFWEINLDKFFFPFGVILFALAGNTAIPELSELLGRRPQKIKRVIIIGSLLPLAVFIIFTIGVIGVTGADVSPDAISSLQSYLGRPAVLGGSIFGFLAVMTSFLTLGLNLKKIFWYDYKINKHFSSFLVLIIPLIFFILGARNFITIISLAGIFVGGLESILIMMLFREARRRGEKRVSYRTLFPDWLPYIIVGVFVLGILVEIYYYLINF